jgi:hypothetical protein
VKCLALKKLMTSSVLNFEDIDQFEHSSMEHSSKGMSMSIFESLVQTQ